MLSMDESAGYKIRDIHEAKRSPQTQRSRGRTPEDIPGVGRENDIVIFSWHDQRGEKIRTRFRAVGFGLIKDHHLFSLSDIHCSAGCTSRAFVRIKQRWSSIGTRRFFRFQSIKTTEATRRRMKEHSAPTLASYQRDGFISAYRSPRRRYCPTLGNRINKAWPAQTTA